MVESGAAVFDCESTGLDTDAEIVEISILDIPSGDVLLDTLVKPTRPIPAAARHIHGIDNDMVADAPSWPEIHANVAALIGHRPLLAYNVPFDHRMLQQTAQRHGLALEIPRNATCARLPHSGCVMRLFAHWWDLDSGWWNLSEAAEFCGASTMDAHRALADCRQANAILHYIAKHPRRRK